MSYYEDVEEFHRKMGLPHSNDGEAPHLLDHNVLLFRLGFMLEEIVEIIQAATRNDLPKVLDGLVDLTYVGIGTAALGRLPFDEAWNEVHRTNMAKERASGSDDPRSIRGHILDVVKPKGWTPPLILPIIEAATKKAADRENRISLSNNALGDK